MSDNILKRGLSRRQFLKTTAATAAAVAIGDKLFGGPVSTLVESTAAAAAPAVTEDKWIPTLCWHCSNGCGIVARRVNGVIVKIEGNPNNGLSRGKACARANAAIMRLYNRYQVKTPLKRTNPVRAQKNPTTGEWEIPDPGWKEITWEEALSTIAEKMKKIRADNPNKFVQMDGWNIKETSGVIDQFYRSFGTINRITGYGGLQCGASMHFAANLLQGTSSTRSDAKYNRFTISVTAQGGVDISKAGVDELWQWRDAKAAGARSIVIDPRYGISASKADEWIPIRPGTGASMACTLSMLNVILHELNKFDVESVKLRTNAPYLIGPDGFYVRDPNSVMEDPTRNKQKFGKPLIWDPVDKKAKTWDDKTIKDFALEGTYTVEGVKCQPAFQMLKDSVKQYTPEWAAKISEVPADTLRRLAKEYVEAANIGGTIEIDGHEMPLRPVTIGRNYQPFSSRNRHHQVTLNHTGGILEMLMGALDVPGGRLAGTNQKPNPVDGIVTPASHTAWRFKWPPDAYQQDTFYPLAYKAWAFFWLQILDRKKYYTPYEVEALAVMGANPIMDGGSPDINMEALSKIPFVWAFGYHLDEPVEMADIVLPDPGWTGRYSELAGLRQPLLDKPLYDQRLPEDVLLDLSERIGIREDLLNRINSRLPLTGDNKLDTKGKYTWEQITDRMLKEMYGKDHDLAWFKVNGVYEPPVSEAEQYGYYKYPKARYAMYWDYIKWCGQELKRQLDKVGVQHPHPEAYDEYKALPVWVESAIEDVPPEYDMWAINWKGNLMAMGMTADNPWLFDVMRRFDPYIMNVLINSETAKAKGIQDGDLVVVESGNTGLKVEAEARVTETIHPRTVAIGGQAGHYSKHLNPFTREGAHYNRLCSIEPKYNDPLSCGFDIGSKVKVYKKTTGGKA